jgi:hypothetical protein
MSCNGLEWIQPPSNESRLPGCYAYYDPPARIVDELNRLVDRNKRLEDIINRAHLAFFSDSSDRKVSIAMHRILDEEVRKEAP